MKRRNLPSLVSMIWLTAGLILGAVFALLVVKSLDVAWVEATGTWFGAVATVLALFWAVQVFRLDQAHRDSALQEARAADALAREESKLAETRAARAAEQAHVDRAARVSMTIRAGGGFGGDGNWHMNNVYLRFFNETDSAVTIEDVEFDSPLEGIGNPVSSLRVPASAELEKVVAVDPAIRVDDGVLNNPWTHSNAVVTYRVNGSRWRRTTGVDSVPERI